MFNRVSGSVRHFSNTVNSSTKFDYFLKALTSLKSNDNNKKLQENIALTHQKSLEWIGDFLDKSTVQTDIDLKPRQFPMIFSTTTSNLPLLLEQVRVGNDGHKYRIPTAIITPIGIYDLFKFDPSKPALSSIEEAIHLSQVLRYALGCTKNEEQGFTTYLRSSTLSSNNVAPVITLGEIFKEADAKMLDFIRQSIYSEHNHERPR